MRTLKFPLVASYNNRSFAAVSGKDQFVKGAIYTRIVNKASQSATWYLEKREGLLSAGTISSGKEGYGVYASPSTSVRATVYSNAGGGIDLFYASTNCGTLSATTRQNISFTEIIIGGITYIMMTATQGPAGTAGGTGWYLASDATSTTLAQTGTTHSNTTVDGITSTVGYYAGQAYSGSGIAANTRIASVDSANAITLTIAASTGVTATFTREAVAKIIDADFPTDIVGGFAELDGYVNIMTSSGRVYQSDINTVASWGAANYLTCSKYSDKGVGVFRFRNQVVAFGTSSIEFLYNAGNTSGSTMSSSDNSIGSTGIPPHYFSAVAMANGILYWIGKDSCVYRMSGFSPEKISELPIKAQAVITATQYLYASCVSALEYRRKTYLLCSQVDDAGLFANFLLNTDDGIPTDPAFGAFSAFASIVNGIAFVVLGNTSGKIFVWYDDANANTTFQDNGGTLTMSVQIAVKAGINGSKGGEFSIVGDVQTSGSLSISVCDDDSGTFVAAPSISLTNSDMRIKLGGIWKNRRLIKIEHTANTPCRIEQLQYKVTDIR